MRLIRLAAAVLNQTPLAWDRNRENILSAISAARQAGASVLCLPELCITGYGCEDAFHSPGVARMAERVLGEILPETDGIVVSVGLPVLHQGGLFSMACLAADTKIVGMVGKQHLASEGLHYEPRWFRPWPKGVRVEKQMLGTSCPMGDLLFDAGGVRIGFEVCEDAWAADRSGTSLAQQGVDILLNPSASHFAFGKHQVRRRFVLDGSRALQVSYVYANLLGNEAGRAIYDGDAMIASSGRMLATGTRFSFADWKVTTAVVDVDVTRMNRARSGSFPVDVRTGQSDCVTFPFAYPDTPLEPQEPRPADWERSEHLKEEEFTRAIALGLFDYLRKSRSRGFVVSLSGGADSAAVATLAARMVRLALAELGRDELQGKLSYVSELPPAGSESELVHGLLTCVYQSTQNSSATTRDAARQVAEALGAEFLELDVDDLVQGYVRLVSGAIRRQLTWQSDDVALQNIQARARGPSVWLLANLHGALLLATSNRSEAAVGYATMDGDTCGGLSPIAGIDKAFLRRWLRWMEVVGPRGVGPLPELAAVNAQAPTAELRPHAAGQTDEVDLMPYDVLDAAERAAIRDKQTPLEVLRRLQVRFPRYDRQQLGAWVERFFRLWCRNQWKRERYAPSFHVDDENLDPKTWCRFPILSGGYERELRELRASLGD